MRYRILTRRYIPENYLKSILTACFYGLLAVAVVQGTAFAQRTGAEPGYLTRPIRLIVPQAAENRIMLRTHQRAKEHNL